jgi:sucrose-6-phosphate hydrolase SacC (GH32 family)
MRPSRAVLRYVAAAKHWGPHYASQCFSNSPDGRVVQVGWARIDMPGMPFNQTFSVPTNLTLHTTAGGIRMFANPIKELEQLRKPDPKTLANKELTAICPGTSSKPPPASPVSARTSSLSTPPA